MEQVVLWQNVVLFVHDIKLPLFDLEPDQVDLAVEDNPEAITLSVFEVEPNKFGS